MKNIKWEEIQKFYDNNHSLRETATEYNISTNVLYKATKKGVFITRNRSKANIIAHKKYPRKHSKETKEKISKIRLKYLKEHPDQVPYLLNHYSKGESYPEKYFNTIFKNNNLEYERYVQYSIYNMDFCFIDKMINIEIDGDQHIYDDVIIKSNIRKDKFLKKKGWQVKRILWSKYLKLNDKERKNYINVLILEIENEKLKNKNIQLTLTSSGLKKIVD